MKDLDEIVELVSTSLIRYHCCREVPQDMRTSRLNGIQISAGRVVVSLNERKAIGISVLILKEHIDDTIAAVGVIEEDKQTPVNEPSALLELHQW